MTDARIVNADNRILGRLASEVASMVKDGEEVRVVNSEDVVISGKKEKVFDDYKQKYDRGTRHRGPYFPKRPDKILKKTIKGMLPGDDFDSRVKTYLGEPDEFDDAEELEVKTGDELKNRNYVKLAEVSKHIGWTE